MFRKIWLFGLRARGDHRPKSDIDLAILCPNATETDWLSVMDIIDDSDTRLKIDCVKFDQDTMSKELYDNERDKVYCATEILNILEESTKIRTDV